MRAHHGLRHYARSSARQEEESVQVGARMGKAAAPAGEPDRPHQWFFGFSLLPLHSSRMASWRSVPLCLRSSCTVVSRAALEGELLVDV